MLGIRVQYGWLVILAVVVYRLVWLFLSDLPIYNDEAYYLYWANHLDWGYYSKPPMVAALIALTTTVGGEAESIVRIGSMLCYLGSGWAVYRIGDHLQGEGLARWSAVVFLTLPIVGFNSLFITTDAPLFLFWSWTLYLFLRARDQQEQKLLWWGLAGMCGGLGLLSKYTMIALPFSLLLYLLLSSQHRSLLFKPGFWFACMVALVLFLPNLWWNYQHDFITFQHHQEIAQLEQQSIYLDKLIDFWVAQFAVMGPVMFLALLGWAGWLAVGRKLDEDDLLLGIVTVTLFGLISSQAAMSEANANWAAPAYITGTVAVVRWLYGLNQWRWVTVAVGANLMLMLAIYHYHPLTTLLGVELTRKNDPYMRVWGWRELASQLEDIRQQQDPQAWLLSPSRKFLAYFSYYMDRSRLMQVASWQPGQHIGDHYQLIANISALHQQGVVGREQSYLLLTKSRPTAALLSHFDENRYVTRLYRKIYRDLEREIYVTWVRGFRGYN